MHFTFIEFATWNDAMKAMWDGFSLIFTTFICTFFPDADSEDAKDQMGKHIGKTENILTGTKIPYLVVIVNKDLYSFENRTTEDSAGAFPLPSQFPGSEKSRAIEAPGLGKWGQDEEYDRRLWFHDMCRFREEAIGTSKPLDASLKGKSHWEFKEDGKGSGTVICAEVFVLSEDEGGALIVDGDRRTVVHGPNKIEATFRCVYPIRKTLIPVEARTMRVHLDQAVSYVNGNCYFMVKQDGKLVAFGVFEKFE